MLLDLAAYHRVHRAARREHVLELVEHDQGLLSALLVELDRQREALEQRVLAARLQLGADRPHGELGARPPCAANALEPGAEGAAQLPVIGAARIRVQSFSRTPSAAATPVEKTNAPTARPVSGVSSHDHTASIVFGAIRSPVPTESMIAA